MFSISQLRIKAKSEFQKIVFHVKQFAAFGMCGCNFIKMSGIFVSLVVFRSLFEGAVAATP